MLGRDTMDQPTERSKEARLQDIVVPGWFHSHELYEMVADRCPPGAVLVELGSYFGESTVYMASLLKELRKDAEFFSIDLLTWHSWMDGDDLWYLSSEKDREHALVKKTYGRDMRLPQADVVELCRAIPVAELAPVMARMDQRQAASAVAELDADLAASLVGALEAPSAGLLMRRLPETLRDEILDRLPGRVAVALREVLRYGAGTAGALCDPGATTVLVDKTVGEVIDTVRQSGRAYYYVFVVDRAQRLVSVVNLRDLLVAAPEATLADLARPDVLMIQGSAPISVVLAHPAWRDLHALPVVDRDKRFLGLLRHETLKRLESEFRVPADQAAVTVAAQFGELVWLAGGAALGELADALIVPADQRAEEVG